MPKSLRISLIVLGALVLTAVATALLLSRVNIKSQFEAIASKTTGLKVTVNGRASIGLFPTARIALKDVTLTNQDSQIASVGEANIGVKFWPLLRKQVHIDRLALGNVNIEAVRDRNGHFNFTPPAQQPPRAKRSLPAMNLGRVSLAKVTFRYINHESNKELKATDCDFDSNDLHLAEGTGADILKHLALSARLECAEMRNDLFVGTDVRLSLAGERGIFKFAPVTMQMMGGNGSGTIDADFTGEIPEYKVHYVVTKLHVDNLFASLAPGKVGEGFMDFTANLSMRGFDAAAMTATANGDASLHGKDLDIEIGNLDEKLAHYESSQNFNLVDVGAFFIVGPLGIVATKGYNFASIFQGTKGNTHLRIVVSQWKLENGIAHAQDVAMSTNENRLAMKGALDFVNRRFDDVTVAILDHKGCARVEQKIRGPFNKPEIGKPNVFASLTGPLSNLVTKAGELLGKKCDVFYAGTVPP